jgi:hypothetical protein
LSRGFICTMFGIGMTLFSWFGPWAWPAWPALTTMRILVGAQTSFADLPYATRGAILVLLIAINIACWAAAGWVVWWAAQRMTTRRRPAVEP